MFSYAGIGSRKTPVHICDQFAMIAQFMAKKNWTLRSGRAAGADTAFEVGCVEAGGSKLIRVATLYQPALDHAAKFHPNWDACDEHARGLHARNSLVMLGDDFMQPVDCVVCWTEGGAVIGGTGQALRIAAHHQIPVFNFGNETGAQFWGWIATK